MQAFEYCVPTRIVFGKDSVEKLPEQLKKSGASRVLVVYGGHSAKKKRSSGPGVGASWRRGRFV